MGNRLVRVVSLGGQRPIKNPSSRARRRIVSNTAFKIVIVGGEVLFRDVLAATLGLELDFRIVGSFSSVETSLAWIRVNPIDVVLLDVDFIQPSAVDAMARSLDVCARSRVIILSAGNNSREAVFLLRNRLAGTFYKNQPLSMLCKQIRELVQPRRGSTANEDAGTTTFRMPASKFTPRQADVVRVLSKACSNKEIAAELGISENTVKKFLQQIFEKTGTRTRSQLMRLTIEHAGDGFTGDGQEHAGETRLQLG